MFTGSRKCPAIDHLDRLGCNWQNIVVFTQSIQRIFLDVLRIRDILEWYINLEFLMNRKRTHITTRLATFLFLAVPSAAQAGSTVTHIKSVGVDTVNNTSYVRIIFTDNVATDCGNNNFAAA